VKRIRFQRRAMCLAPDAAQGMTETPEP